MINYIDKDFDVDQLMGKIIFHATLGGSAIFRGPQLKNPTNIGNRLGEVVEVNSANRIYYNDEGGNKKYINSNVIGCYCDTENEAEDLENIINKYNDKAQSMIEELASALHDEVNKL
jgi:hypothetical protein